MIKVYLFTLILLLSYIFCLKIKLKEGSAQENQNVTFHTVDQGDTLDYLALRYNTTFENLANSNYFMLNPYLLYPGEVLYIPTNN